MKHFLLLLALIGGILYAKHTMVKMAHDPISRQLQNTEKQSQIRAIRNELAGSPAEKYAHDIWSASDYYRMDYKILLGLLRLESSYMRNAPMGCNNAFGLGIYGDKKLCFQSYKENIYEVARHWQTNSRFKRIDDVVAKGCLWQSGKAVNCPYGLKLASLINSYE